MRQLQSGRKWNQSFFPNAAQNGWCASRPVSLIHLSGGQRVFFKENCDLWDKVMKKRCAYIGIAPGRRISRKFAVFRPILCIDAMEGEAYQRTGICVSSSQVPSLQTKHPSDRHTLSECANARPSQMQKPRSDFDSILYSFGGPCCSRFFFSDFRTSISISLLKER